MSTKGRETLNNSRDIYIEIGNTQYFLSPETQKYLNSDIKSAYDHKTSVLIVGEPHFSIEGQFNLFKGLESFFESNPNLVKGTVFLSEGTKADKSISVQALIKEDPHPTDDTVKQVLSSFMITGYMAYEWKHQRGIPIIGTENEGLYALSSKFASLCMQNSDALYVHRKYEDGLEYDIPLERAWDFVVAARNKRIAQILIEKIGKYKNPILFVATGHLKEQRKPSQRRWDNIISKQLGEIKMSGVVWNSQYPWYDPKEQWMFRFIEDNSESFDIHHYLEQAGIGYSFLVAKGAENMTREDEMQYAKILGEQQGR